MAGDWQPVAEVSQERSARNWSVPRRVRIGSHSGWLGSEDLLFLWYVYQVCEDWLTKWVVGVGSEMVSRTHTLALRLRPTLPPGSRTTTRPVTYEVSDFPLR